MNLVHVGQVLSRHRGLIIAGIIVSILAALFVYGRPGWDGKPSLTPRTPEEWRASSTLFLTQEGFPAGRAVSSPTDPGDDQSRFQSLAVLYAELATSDPVKALAEKGGKVDGEIVAEPVIYTIGQFATPVVLPMVRISVTADTGPWRGAGRCARLASAPGLRDERTGWRQDPSQRTSADQGVADRKRPATHRRAVESGADRDLRPAAWPDVHGDLCVPQLPR